MNCLSSLGHLNGDLLNEPMRWHGTAPPNPPADHSNIDDGGEEPRAIGRQSCRRYANVVGVGNASLALEPIFVRDFEGDALAEDRERVFA